jgi:transcriptional regulator with XRE-family HTH domain
MASGNKIIATALNGLAPRQREVLISRFGLEKGEGETLAKIGDRLGITRERVRQIENAGVALAKANIMGASEITGLLESVKKHITAAGGVLHRDEAVKYACSQASELTGNRLDFLSEASGAFTLHPENDDYHAFYYGSNQDLKAAFAFVQTWVKQLRAKKQKVLGESYDVHLASFVKDQGVDRKMADAYLGISKHVALNPFGDKGLREWPEISPSTIRDKIYLILKKRGEAVHFTDIAKFINEAKFDSHKALVATVHNELIKDKRFALVGRGVYGLTEQGYEQGTAREAIANILKQGPLPVEEVVAKVGQKHFFRENTILINLQNKSFFERLSNGAYRVRES